MPCFCNCHAYVHWTHGERTWVWLWELGGDGPVHGWFNTREVFGDPPPPKPWPRRIAGWVWSAIRNLLGSILLVFLLWLIFFRPYKVRPHVDAAALAAFDLVTVAVAPTSAPPNATATATATALRYDLALNVTFFNDHRIYGIRFDHLTAGLYYNGTKLGPSDAPLPSFKLHTRRHRTVYPVLRGRATAVSSAAVAEALAADRARGRIDVAVRVKITLTYRFWPHRATYYYEYDCWLQFSPPPPAGNNGTAAAVTTGGVKCGVAK